MVKEVSKVSLPHCHAASNGAFQGIVENQSQCEHGDSDASVKPKSSRNIIQLCTKARAILHCSVFKTCKSTRHVYNLRETLKYAGVIRLVCGCYSVTFMDSSIAYNWEELCIQLRN
jgi:hypothetical protein